MPRIHILGIGNIGKLFAHGLAAEDSPPSVSLLLHRASLAKSWEEAGRAVEIFTDGVPSTSKAFDIEVISNNGEDSVIENLIIATKATQTVTALLAVRHRLRRQSTILFTQNGMGTADEVSEKIFPTASSRPHYLACVNSHGLYSKGPFKAVHAGLGAVVIGSLFQQDCPGGYLVQAITHAPLLAAREVSPVELFRFQLEKLVVNSVINPLTAVLNCCNGELLTKINVSRVIRLLLQETSSVILRLPELCDNPTIRERFSPQNLEDVVLNVAEITAKNTSSMLQDVRNEKQTEIDYINGYIKRRGNGLGIECPNNEILIQLVKARRTMSEEEINYLF